MVTHEMLQDLREARDCIEVAIESRRAEISANVSMRKSLRHLNIAINIIEEQGTEK